MDVPLGIFSGPCHNEMGIFSLVVYAWVLGEHCLGGWINKIRGKLNPTMISDLDFILVRIDFKNKQTNKNLFLVEHSIYQFVGLAVDGQIYESSFYQEHLGNFHVIVFHELRLGAKNHAEQGKFKDKLCPRLASRNFVAMSL